jgi:hypothetical protein
LRGAAAAAHNPFVNEASAPSTLPLRIQDEVSCRHCDVHCEKVVYPAACVELACPFVYAYEAWGHTYVGCLQKVYEVEIDLDLLRAAEQSRGGFGAVRATRAPLPMCEVDVVQTYGQRSDELGCRNPEFHELPQDRAGFRVFATIAD